MDKYLSNFDKLVMIVMTIEEGFLSENLQEKKLALSKLTWYKSFVTPYAMHDNWRKKKRKRENFSKASEGPILTIPANMQPRLHISKE